MDIDGLVRIDPGDMAVFEACARILGESFTEEGWTQTLLDGLDATGASRERKREICLAYEREDLKRFAEQGLAWCTPDRAGVAEIFSSKEHVWGDEGFEMMDARTEQALEHLLTPAEAEALGRRERQMERVSDFGWCEDVFPDGAIHLFGLAVDVAARGRGVARQVFDALFTTADVQGLPVVLECYRDHLVSMYRHFGFEEVRTFTDERLRVCQHCMARPASRGAYGE